MNQNVISGCEKFKISSRIRTSSEAGAMLRQYSRLEEQLGLHILCRQSQVPRHHRGVRGWRSVHRAAPQQGLTTKSSAKNQKSAKQKNF